MIVKCTKCGLVQYILEGQNSRICPKCNILLKCKDLKIFEKALSVTEASQLVRDIKSPKEIWGRVDRFRASQKQTNQDDLSLLGELITELISIFPNALPKSLLLEKAIELGISEDKIEGILISMNQKGAVLINKSKIQKQTESFLKFPAIPINFGKLHIKKPISQSKFLKKPIKPLSE